MAGLRHRSPISSRNTMALIKTHIPHSQIDRRVVTLNRPADGLHNVPAMLEVWPREDGIVVSTVQPYDPQTLSSRPRQVTEYGDLTQEEFDQFFPPAEYPPLS
jgi:hypothetical protein